MVSLHINFFKLTLRFAYSLVLLFVLNGCALITPKKADAFLLSWPMAYLELHGLGQRTDMFLGSEFWSYLKKIDLEPFIADEKVRAKLNVEYKAIVSQLEQGLGAKGWRQLFGQEMYMAMYAPGRVKDSPENALSHTIVAGKMSLLAKGAAHLTSFWGEFIEGVQVDSEAYHGERIYRIYKADSVNLFFVTRGDYLYLSMDDRILKKCLDNKKNKRLSLLNQKSHKDYKNNLERSIWLSGYFDFTRYRLHLIKNFQKDIDDTSKSEDELLKSQAFIQRLNNFTGLGNFIFSLSKNDEITEQLSLSVTYDENNLSDILSHSLNKPNRKNRSFSFMPPDTRFYFWYTNMEADVWWSTYSMLVDPSKVEVLRKSVLEKYSLDLEREILPALADDFGVVAFPYESKGAEKMSVSVFTEFVSAKYGVSVLSKLLSVLPLQFNTVKYRDYEVQRAAMPLIEELEPSFFAWDKYLIFNSSFAALRDMADASKKPGENFLYSEEFKHMDFGLSDENLSSMYIDADYFIRILKDILRSDKMFAMAEGGEANEIKIGTLSLREFVDSYFVKLIDCFSFVDALSARVFKGDERLVLNIYTKLNK